MKPTRQLYFYGFLTLKIAQMTKKIKLLIAWRSPCFIHGDGLGRCRVRTLCNLRRRLDTDSNGLHNIVILYIWVYIYIVSYFEKLLERRQFFKIVLSSALITNIYLISLIWVWIKSLNILYRFHIEIQVGTSVIDIFHVNVFITLIWI